jgi:hypothetical protein
MDIANIDTVKAATAGAEMKVLHPTENTVLKNEDGSNMTITLIGTDSDTYRKAQRFAINRRMRSGRGRSTAEELEQDALELLAVATQKWNITLGGSKPECTRDIARETYAKVPWLREQVDTFINDRSNFLKASETN